MASTAALKPYRLSAKKYCPTCGGKAQDAQTDHDANVNYWEEDGTPVRDEPWTPEPCDEPYHDPADPDYVED